MALYAFDGAWNIDEVDDDQDANVMKFKGLDQTNMGASVIGQLPLSLVRR